MPQEIDPEALRIMRDVLPSFERELEEISGLTAPEWDWRRRVVAMARRRLAVKHDTETMELAIEMIREALAELGALDA